MIENKAFQGSITVLTPQAFFAGLVRVGITALLVFAFIFFFFNLVLGGIAWINSAGDKTKLETARAKVVNAIIGVVVVLVSFAIVRFIETIFGVNITSFNFSSLQI